MSRRPEVRDPMSRAAHLLDLTQDAIFFWEFAGPGRAGPITVWNPASARLYGYTSVEALGRIGHELLRTRHPQGSPTAFELDLERTGEWRGELGHTTRDGRQLAVESHQLLVADPDGRRWVLESNRDVTGRKRAEEDLRQSEERFRNLAETAHEGIWLIDLDARTLFANARMAELLGTSVASIMGRPVHDFCFPEDVVLAQERIGQNLHGQVEQFEFRFRRLDGTAVHMLASTSPVRDASETIVGALGMFSDFTERKLAEEARVRLERDKDAFFAAVSHDLKNPLTSIKAAARMGRALDLEPAPTDLVELVRQAISEQQVALPTLRARSPAAESDWPACARSSSSTAEASS